MNKKMKELEKHYKLQIRFEQESIDAMKKRIDFVETHVENLIQTPEVVSYDKINVSIGMLEGFHIVKDEAKKNKKKLKKKLKKLK